MRKILLIFAIIFLPLAVFAAQDEGIYTYHFHLYFDHFDQEKLVPDRDFSTAFDLVAEPYQTPNFLGIPFNGQILSVSGNKLANFSFDVPHNGKGKFTATAPYFDNAKTVNFYNEQGQKLLTLDLAPDGPVCNEDGVCNANTGETHQNCPSDCPLLNASATPSPSVIPVPVSGWLSFLSPTILLIILAVILILVWLWLRRRRNPSAIPPSPQV